MPTAAGTTDSIFAGALKVATAGVGPTPRGRSTDVVDLFSGCGGLSYGFHVVGEATGAFNPIAAFDTYRHANATFEANLRLRPLEVDLGAVPISNVPDLVAPSRQSSRLVVIGGPPCQGFSAMRKGATEPDDRNSLVQRFGQMAVALGADVIAMENVPDLLSQRHWRHFTGLRDVLLDAGYAMSVGIVNMAEFGVPQERFRALVIAAKDGAPSLPPPVLTRSEFRTVRDAIAQLPTLAAGGSCDEDPMHFTSRHRRETVEILRQVPPDGGSRPPGVGPRCLDGVKGFYDVYGRLQWDKPAVTITARCRTPSCGRFAHPDQDRGLSVREAALLQGFPTSFELLGPFDDKFKQIGNAVPPLFSIHLAGHVLALLNGRSNGEVQRLDRLRSAPFKSFSGIIGSLKRNGGRWTPVLENQCLAPGDKSSGSTGCVTL